ncbi:MAG: transglycosylase SLT domain-containing protein [Terriglobia bacterium]
MRSKSLHFAWRFILLPALLSLGCTRCAFPAQPIPKQLASLAARAKTPSGWGPLRRFAKSSQNAESEGLAWFTLGYREYAAGRFALALQDLRTAAETNFTLSDFAEYYEARAARAAEQPGAGIEALRGFSSSHPQSLLRTEAADLLAELLIEANQPAQAVDLLLAEPELHSFPSLLLSLGNAESLAGKPDDAARADQEVFYHFPISTEAGKAQVALRELRRRLGAGFPEPTDTMRSKRAATLFHYGRFEDALQDYTGLEEERRSNPLALDWTAARARCFFHLKRYEQAAQIVAAPMTGHPEEDASRLEILVNVRAHQDNENGMATALNELGKLYPASPDYGLALSHAGFFYARGGRWKAAAPYYALAASGFPSTPTGEEATWKTAWFDYLAGNVDGAAKTMAHFILRYPDSLRVPAALYWLGRLAQDGSDSVDARAYFSALSNRYPQQYYASLAGSLMPASREESPPAESAPPAGTPATLSTVAASVTRAIPSLQGTILAPCALMPADGIMQPYQTFLSLSLDDLAEDYLQIAAAVRPVNPWVFLALARAHYAQGRVTAALFAARRAVPDDEDFEFDALPREIWDYLYPRSYWSLVRREARANRLDPYLVMAVIRQESAFDPKALSGAGAVGLMQMLPQTVNSRLRGRRRGIMIRRLEDPAYNLRLSCHYFRRLLAAFDSNTGEALAAYNAGDVRVRQWLDGNHFRSPQEFIETTPFADTRAYVEDILRDASIYRQLLGGTAHFASCERSFPPNRKHQLRRASSHRRRR